MAGKLPSREHLQQILDYDPETSNFVWKPRPRGMFPSQRSWSTWNARYAGKSAGCSTHVSGYLLIGGGATKLYRAHRLAWLLAYGEPVPDIIDHIDGNKLNNRISNLRAASMSGNIANAKLRADNTTGFKGVYREPRGCNSFVAEVRLNGKNHYVGAFKTPQEAALARQAAAQRLHGLFARDQ